VTARIVAPLLLAAWLVVGGETAVWCSGVETASVAGLWRLMAIMPAGVPSEETPQQLSRHLYYWFHGDGALTVLNDHGEAKKRKVGVWKQKGTEVVIVWDTGYKVRLRIVRAAKDFMIISGFDLRPLWYRFTRVF
jgi:hypothetical protein